MTDFCLRWAHARSRAHDGSRHGQTHGRFSGLGGVRNLGGRSAALGAMLAMVLFAMARLAAGAGASKTLDIYFIERTEFGE